MNGYDSVMDLIGGRKIAYSPRLAKIAGGPLPALFLAQCIYWQKQLGEFTWWEKTREQWQEETSFSRRNIETARRRLRERGLLEETREGVPCRILYRVHRDTILKALGLRLDDGAEPPRWIASSQLDGAPPSQLDGAHRANTHHQTKERKKEEEEGPLDLEPWPGADDPEGFSSSPCSQTQDSGVTDGTSPPRDSARAARHGTETPSRGNPAPNPESNHTRRLCAPPAGTVAARVADALSRANLKPSARTYLESIHERFSAGKSITDGQNASVLAILGESERAESPTVGVNVPTRESQVAKAREDLAHDEQVLRERIEDGLPVPAAVVARCVRRRERLELGVPAWLVDLVVEEPPPPKAKRRRFSAREADARLAAFAAAAPEDVMDEDAA